jgi:hypothetical protein
LESAKAFRGFKLALTDLPEKTVFRFPLGFDAFDQASDDEAFQLAPLLSLSQLAARSS